MVPLSLRIGDRGLETGVSRPIGRNPGNGDCQDYFIRGAVRDLIRFCQEGNMVGDERLENSTLSPVVRLSY
tara:strand:+ start:581 stop:793 length:213 start_codon:yes stop_codon:yes gene_type:complete